MAWRCGSPGGLAKWKKPVYHRNAVGRDWAFHGRRPQCRQNPDGAYRPTAPRMGLRCTRPPHQAACAARRPLLSERVIVPVAAAIAAALLAEEPFEAVVLTMLAFACAAFVVPERSSWANLLPLMRAPLVLLSPLLGTAALALVNAVTDLPGLSAGELVIVALAAAAASVTVLPVAHSRRRQGPLRTAIIGSERAATDVAPRAGAGGHPRVSGGGSNRDAARALARGRRGADARRARRAGRGDRGERHRPARAHERGAALRRLRGDVDHCLHLPVRL